MREVNHFAADAEHARFRMRSEGRDGPIASACRSSSPDGVNAALISGALAGWMASFPVKPSRARGVRFGP